jgi:hypothetical protein
MGISHTCTYCDVVTRAGAGKRGPTHNLLPEKVAFTFEVNTTAHERYFPSHNQVNYKKIKPLLGKSKRMLFAK